MPEPAFDAAAEAAAILARLHDHASEERRLHTHGYFPTAMRILGVGVPALRALARERARALRAVPPARVLSLCDALLATNVHEARQVAYEIVAARRDVAPLIRTRAVRRLGLGNDNWASVDAFATLVAGPAWRDGRIADAEVMRWAASADLWWRRTALAATVALNTPSRGGHGDVDRTLRVCDALAADREPLVVKALSWALRTLVPHDADAVRRFLAGHTLHPSVVREVRNKLGTGTKSGR